MNSQARSACYPQSTFYPMSDGPSMQNHRITKTCFRTCSTCRSHSQAPLCLYTLRLVSNQPEGTFARLRYSFGRRPPQSNCPPGSVPDPDYGPGLEAQNSQGGISTLAPPRPESRLQSLPPILRRLSRTSLPSCSKGSWGLSVLPRVEGIFTPDYNFAESLVETVGMSLRHSCRSELTRQGISLP